MSNKHEIEIPDLPDGWRAVSYRSPVDGVDYILNSGKVSLCDFECIDSDYLIVERIKPREITLIEITKEEYIRLCQTEETLYMLSGEYWKLKEE